ncbi:MAG: preprotein translocase subunit SecG [Methyloceanibacter sp.]|jgi:preprotein translocase subunit SecG|nr:preprotein translocase subunit SecG [Methyloceanibacter sp.]
MITVLLLVHIMIAVALVGVILLQRSEGGALGIGGGGGGFMTGRSAGNALTKTTAVLAGCFFVSSLVLSILASQHRGSPSILSPASQTGGPIPGLAPLQVPAAPAPASPPAPATPASPSAPAAP